MIPGNLSADPTGRHRAVSGDVVDVWIGALTGSPGVPPPDPITVTQVLDHWDPLGRAYVLSHGEHWGMYVAGPAIIEAEGRS